MPSKVLAMVRIFAAVFVFLAFPARTFAGELPPEGRWFVVSGVQLGEKLTTVTDKDDPYLGQDDPIFPPWR